MKRIIPPKKQGLYDPAFEHDACGIGFIANVKGEASHDIVKQGLSMLCRLEHRGGQGSDPQTGDGAGIMVQLPHKFFQKACSELSIPNEGSYGVGMLFLPRDATQQLECENLLNEIIEKEGQRLLGWRTVPTDDSKIGESGKLSQPQIRQVFVGKAKEITDEQTFGRKLYLIRKRAEKAVQEKQLAHGGTFYFSSLSTRTIVYKGMLTPDQLDKYYIDLQDSTFQSVFALVHSRFSTNTFPSWERAHPNRYLIHNGEINTLKGNVNWMKAREQIIESAVFGDSISEIIPVIDANGSDSSSFDNCLEFLTLSGRSLSHAAMMMVPQPWEKDDSMDDSLKAFYEYHSHLMEPWDGPAAFAFTDGLQIGAMLDRNGLRPARYYVTADNMIIFASEAGVLDIEPERISEKRRLSPGSMLLVDLKEGRIITDEEVKRQVASRQPYRHWLDNECIHMDQLPAAGKPLTPFATPIVQLQRAFGYTYEELTKHLAPMAAEGKEPVGSMGNDTPLAVLSNRPQLLYNYFKQLFAQVTNPPIDAIREQFVTSTVTLLGAEGNLLESLAKNCRRIRLETPICSDDELAKLRHNPLQSFQSKTFSTLFEVEYEETALEKALNELFHSVDRAVKDGVSLIILSDQHVNKELAAIPSLLAVSGLHHHLVRRGTRTKVSIIVETGEARDVHQLCMLIGYGADAINPYLAYASIKEMVNQGKIQRVSYAGAVDNYIQAATSGMVKVLSKMGISTIQSYRGAQIFEAVGIDSSVIDKYFTGTAARLGGIKLETIAKETLMRHEKAFCTDQDETLEEGSDFQWRHGEEAHAFHPATIHMLQHACRTNNYELYKKYAAKANEEQLIFLRGLFQFKKSAPVPIDEVESVESICRRFKTGAMSYGSLSQEAHETLAIAMNRIGGKSNSGEGGEHPDRCIPDENGDLRRSAIKQVASGRFGVSSHYLVNADEIQIKMAQGAKPGEGGQLPGSKVYPWIAEVRGSTPGVGLISPPPHHDIYSIEDLAQLIHDLKNANPHARISVKLVAKAGVGTIAAGVAKGLADVILISGSEGGTGAASRTSIKHAGMPWELGLAETHQTLLLNDLRDRVVLEADGKMMTGRDVVMATLLGAEEYGFATAPLVVLGCVLVRACHLNTCPVGVATQDPELRKKFLGEPEHIENFMRFIAQDVREIMAELGFRTINEMVGRTDVLMESEMAKTHWKAKKLDLSSILYVASPARKGAVYNQRTQNHRLEQSLDYREVLRTCQPALERRQQVTASFPIQNINRTAGTMLGSEITERYGREGLPDGTIQLQFTGSAGQSFASFLPKGVTMTLEGEANDYVGKGLSGGKIIVNSSGKSVFVPEENSIIGNVAFYGGTAGEAYIRGLAGERFCVRNSGVDAVVEGIGDHGCEYMTGGRVVVLGSVGKNFAAGMSGGTAYVYTEDTEAFGQQCNQELVYLESLDHGKEREEVKQLVLNHYRYTNSSRAWYILHHWEEVLAKWVKVIPAEYKRIMESGFYVSETQAFKDEADINVVTQKSNRADGKNLEPA
ncbi:glutamate synthase large subunit [Bacillus aerolatus]|uniref:Glutamate synthase large subunit n=1 Tax=Bacillus aerolatus TaxID=2653354 RepID=A0A6I1FDN9_9BACI|nr:glutamate synthase large subunit [Bacillus aerolatus]KAB7705657.1 glutamate synthase large subunit [Bacillus aerolatus]